MICRDLQSIMLRNRIGEENIDTLARLTRGIGHVSEVSDSALAATVPRIDN